MARNDGIDRTVARNVNLTASKIANAQRHNEREKESYTNPDIVPERLSYNVHFKTPTGSYAEMFEQMKTDGVISTRGLKDDANLYGELIFDVNSAYFYNHGGYEFVKQFYADAYKAAVDIVGGEQYILSAVMHADERNRAMSEALGEDVYHYHLHVVYIPVVEKQILWSKRCKDKSLVGTVKETIMQVSSSKKWQSKTALDENGNPMLTAKGKPILKKSYSVLQDDFFNAMRTAGYTDVERGERGSTEEHLTVTQFKVQSEQERLEQLREAIIEKQNDMESLLSDLEAVTDKLSTTEAELDSAKQNRDAIQEQYRALSSGMKNAEKYAAEFIRPPDEWLPTPTPLESAKGYRSRIIPMMAHFGKLLLKLYTQCVNLKEKCRQLVHRNENLTRQVERLQVRLTESESREEQVNQELSDYHLLRKHLGTQVFDQVLGAARQAQASIAREKKQKETIHR